MGRSGPINVGVVKRETKLKELWREAKRIMAGVKSSRWRGSEGGGGGGLGGWGVHALTDRWPG